METQPAFGFKDLVTQLVGDTARAVSERSGETRQQQFLRTQAAVHTVMEMLPRDGIEVMLAGHCLMLHELLTAGVHDALCSERSTARRAAGSGILAMDKAFGNNLRLMEYYQGRAKAGCRDIGPVTGPAPAKADPVAPEARPASRPAPQPAAAPTRPAAATRPSPDAIAALRANPVAMAALDEGDPAAFARAMGVVKPSAAYLAAAAATMTPTDRRSLLGSVSTFGTRATGYPPAARPAGKPEQQPAEVAGKANGDPVTAGP